MFSGFASIYDGQTGLRSYVFVTNWMESSVTAVGSIWLNSLAHCFKLTRDVFKKHPVCTAQ